MAGSEASDGRQRVELGIANLRDVHEIGRGAFAVVYRATQDPFDRSVAVKVLNVSIDDPTTRERFRRECRAVARLGDQPGVVSVFEAGELPDGRPYLVMRDLTGGALDQRIRVDGPLDWRTTAAIGIRLGRVLATAHATGVVHCDVKPANVLFDAVGDAYLADFGIAAFVDGGSATATGTFGATPAYSPPEALDGEMPAAARDVYSLAATLHACLTGNPPFSSSTGRGGNGLIALMRRIAEEPPEDLTTHGVPPSVAEVIIAAMAKDDTQRPDAAVFAATLAQATERLGVTTATMVPTAPPAHQAPPDRPADRPADRENTAQRPKPAPARPRRSTRPAVIAGAAAAALVGVGVWVVTRPAGDGGPSPRQDQPVVSASAAVSNVVSPPPDLSGSATTRAPSSVAPPPVTIPAPGDRGPAIASPLAQPTGMAVGPDGSLYIADTNHHRIRRVDPTGIITTVAGIGTAGLSGDNGPAVAAELNAPAGVAVTSDGTMYIADTHNHRVRRVDPDGTITTIAGKGLGPGYDGDGGPGLRAMLSFPADVVVMSDGAVVVAEAMRIRRIRADGIITTFAGTGTPGADGDGGPATQATVVAPSGLVALPDGALIFIDYETSRIRTIDSDGIITAFAGTGDCCGQGDGGLAAEASIWRAKDIARGRDGSLFIAETESNVIRRIGPEGVITTVAGTGPSGAAGDGGAALSATFNQPAGIVVGTSGTIFVADTGNDRVRAISGDGVVSTYAGSVAA